MKKIIILLSLLTLSGCSPDATISIDNSIKSELLEYDINSKTATPCTIVEKNAKKINLPDESTILYFDNKQVIYYIDEWTSNGQYLDLSLYKYKFADDSHMDLEKFSKKYYEGYPSVGAYDKSVYIKGDFTKSFDHYNTYNTNNIETQNKNSYKLLTNNCSHVVIEGFGKGQLADGTNAGGFIVERMGYQYMYPSFPKGQIDDFQHIFYNEAFTCEEYHSQLNNQLWEYKSASHFWNKSKRDAKFIERIK